jgi:hypothetical protein
VRVRFALGEEWFLEQWLFVDWVRFNGRGELTWMLGRAVWKSSAFGGLISTRVSRSHAFLVVQTASAVLVLLTGLRLLYHGSKLRFSF